MAEAESNSARLEKKLGLMDVYAICTGAMFASGFFLLPGIAAANAGPAVILAYFASSLLMVPAMYSIAELSSAMPRAAGTYFFIHRSMGPLAGTVGGLGAWVVLVAKSAFALVGMGAYLALFFDVPVQPLAIALTVAFGLLNVFGAKETAKLQVWLVVTLVSIMVFFIAAGAFDLVRGDPGVTGQFTPFFEAGLGGLVATIGLVFISYAGLTKVSSSAEEIQDLDRNLPLGMILALATVGIIYTAGVALLVAILPADELRGDLTPVASGAEVVFDWLPGAFGVGLIVIAAVAAFASTGNAGILTASRYPLAMARDRLLWSGFDRLGRFGTPTLAIVVTCALMIVLILFLDVERLASLGSAFLLLLFALLNVSVILMRESRLPSYAPGYRSPLYPWMQIVGVVTTLGLIVTLGTLYLGFILAILVLSYVWYRMYVRSRVEDRAALYGLFLRLGRKHDEGVDAELFGILQERGAEAQDSFDELVARAPVFMLPEARAIEEVWEPLADGLREKLDRRLEGLDDQLETAAANGVLPEGAPAVILELFREDFDHPEVALVRPRHGVELAGARRFPGNEPEGGELDEEHDSPGPVVDALIVLMSPEGQVTQHLRLLAQLVTMVEEDGFSTAWRDAPDEQALRETLLRDERFASLVLGSEGPLRHLIGQGPDEVDLPGDTLVALVHRGGETFVPTPGTAFRAGDRITVVGSPSDVAELLGRGDGRE
jgi:basic amino acid/polyamine antiporter, APA family